MSAPETEPADDDEAPLDALVPDALTNARGERVYLIKGIEADRRMALAVPSPVKWAFMLTNAPYWLLFLGALHRVVREIEHAVVPDEPLHWCDRAESYLIISLFVAVSSTLMHGSQMRLGQHLCCGHAERARGFHHPSLQVRLKKFDIGCALTAALATTTCHEWWQLALCGAVAVPCFFGGIVLKRIEWHNAYLLTHGLWHIVTAVPAVNALFFR